MSSLERPKLVNSIDLHSTPRPARHSDPLMSSIDFTPAKDFSGRTTSFKRLSGSANRTLRVEQISSVLSKPRLDSSEFKIFVDIPLEQEAKETSCRGKSPSTPKRTRADIRQDMSFFDDMSPIASPKMVEGDIRSTPKRRRSTGFMRSSMGDIFVANRREDCRELDTGLSKSADFSGIIARRDYTPPRTRSQSRLLKTPQAPRKPSRFLLSSSSLPNMDEFPKPRRLFDAPTETSASAGIDYSAVMSVVGFISSYITRQNERKVPLSQLVDLISSMSINHRSPSSAQLVLRNLAKAVPEWVSVRVEAGDEIYSFSSALKSFDVLSKLRDLKRERWISDSSN